MDGYIYDIDINKNNNYKKGKRFASCLFSPVFASVITASRWSLQVLVLTYGYVQNIISRETSSLIIFMHNRDLLRPPSIL